MIPFFPIPFYFIILFYSISFFPFQPIPFIPFSSIHFHLIPFISVSFLASYSISYILFHFILSYFTLSYFTPSYFTPFYFTLTSVLFFIPIYFGSKVNPFSWCKARFSLQTYRIRIVSYRSNFFCVNIISSTQVLMEQRNMLRFATIRVNWKTSFSHITVFNLCYKIAFFCAKRTGLGRARAWLRLAMMQKKVADYLNNLLAHKDILR